MAEQGAGACILWNVERASGTCILWNVGEAIGCVWDGLHARLGQPCFMLLRRCLFDAVS